MPIRIYKYPLRPGVLIPDNARILSVQVQYGDGVIWAEVDTREPLVCFNFVTVITGGKPPVGGRYLGTLQFNQGDFVTHVYRM